MTRHPSKKTSGSVLLTVLLVCSLAVGTVSVASASEAGIQNVTVVDRVDEDGDGRVSSFTVEIDAETYINEKGEAIDGGGLYTNFGEPWFGVYLSPKSATDYGSQPDMYKGMKTAEDTIRLRYDYDDVKSRSDENNPGHWDVVTGQTSLKSFSVQYLESDSTWDDKDLSKDETIVRSSLHVLDNPLTLESPANDELGDVTVNTNPTGATVYIDGEKKGATPLNVELPVDVSEKDGPVDIRVEKEGYQDKLRKELLNPPEQVDYTLSKERKALVVDANLENATVRVDGRTIGKTPVSKAYWTEKDLTITVEKSGHGSQTFRNVRAPRKIDASFNTTSDGGSSDLIYAPGLLEQSLVTQLPLLGSMYQANFTSSSDSVGSGETVTFDGGPSYDIVNNISAYRWRVDGTVVGSGQVMTHRFDTPGTYSVNLTVVNTQGTKAFTTDSVVVNNLAPTPQYTVSPSSIEAGETVTFDGTSSTDADGQIVSYEWTVDGSLAGQGAALKHTFTSAGSHTVELTVRDSHGATETMSRTFTVAEQNVPPKSQFTVSNNNPQTGDVITLDASASTDSDGNITAYSWNLGDGLSKSGQTVQYNYKQSGTYNVELTVTDGAGARATTTKTIIVQGEDITPTVTPTTQRTETSQLSEQTTSQRTETDTTQPSETTGTDTTENAGLLDRLLEFLENLF